MKRSLMIASVLAVSLVFAMGSGWAQTHQFSGRVYDGAVGVETTPISGVTVTLYGSNNSGQLGTVIASTTTDAAGWYGLTEIRTSYEFYTIVETDPSGYNSTGAKSSGGTVINSNQIEYAYPLDGKTLTGNKFYDRKPQTSQNFPPVADAGGPYSCNVGGSITFDGSGSYDPDSDDSITKYEWDLDNDGQYDDATGVATKKTFNSAGSGTVGLRVTDSQGSQDTDTATYTVSEESQSGGAIYGMVFNDLNRNYQKDAGEPGLSGWQITLTDPSGTLTTTTTGSNGTYSFTDLTPNNNVDYGVAQTIKTGWIQTYPEYAGEGGYTIYAVPVGANKAYSGIDFGNMESSTTQPGEDLDYGDAPSPYPEASDSLGGPWLGVNPPDPESGMQRDAQAQGDDKNATDDEDGFEFQGGAMPLGGIALGELSAHGVLEPYGQMAVAWWVDFNGDGDWGETDETMGFHIVNAYGSNAPVDFYLKGPLMHVPANAKVGKTFARARIFKGHVDTFLPSGAGGPGEVEDFEVEIKDTGIRIPSGGFVCGSKINDLNGNGVWDPGEPGLANWPIWLDMNGNGIQDPSDPVTQTDANGDFFFTGLSAGTYTVGEVQQPGWVQTIPGPGATFTQTVTGQTGPMKSLIFFGNHQIVTPGGGEGAVKWFQPPLFNPEKFEEKCFYGWGEPSIDGAVTLADDWFCYNPRPVTSVTWWGTYAGWKGTTPPEGAPQQFHIGIWSHTPKGGDFEWGHPNRMIREWFVDKSQLGETIDRYHRMPEWKDNLPDTCFRYTFPIPGPEWFHQEGDSTEYWLSIAAAYTEPPGEHVWGWLTRELYFNAGAVRIFAPASSHPDSLFRIGEPLPPHWDMAFLLGTDQNTALFDFGDASVGFGTDWSHNAALHLIRHDVRLGATVDAEDDSRPDPAALSDDNNGSDDEEGVTFLGSLVPGNMAEAAVSVSCRGFLNAWLDINGNGKWDPREHVVNNLGMSSGNQVVRFPVADDAAPGPSVMRFRFSTLPDVWVKGFVPDGEVEDYQVEIRQPITAVDEHSLGNGPGQFRLYPNFPNPFNPSTTIRFDLPRAALVRLSIYNLMGQEIAVLVNENRMRGSHEVLWDGRDDRHAQVPSGVYLYRLEAASCRATGKLLLLK
jgi:hypothetical protein